ncbi:MAG: hypothetical protein JW827_01140 [Spirochaetes bacterium]|nr:hypothetical protein [Spirochaetota bacterium]
MSEKNSFSFLSFFCFLLLISCGKNEVTFRVDKNLLKEVYESMDTGIQVWIPRGLEKISKRQQSLVKERIKKDTLIQIELEEFYINMKDGIFCFISTFKEPGKISRVVNEYKEKLAAAYPDSKIRYAAFYSRGIDFHQFQVVSAKFVNYKLLFFNRNRDIIQIDYIIPFQYYKEQLRSIESSIGSIRLL